MDNDQEAVKQADLPEEGEGEERDSKKKRERDREEHSMDRYRSRLKLSENFERHWSIPFPGEIHMDQSLVHTFSWGNSYGPMVLRVLRKFPPTLVLVHGWLFPERERKKERDGEGERQIERERAKEKERRS